MTSVRHRNAGQFEGSLRYSHNWTLVARHTGRTLTLAPLPFVDTGLYDIGVWAVDGAGNEGDDTEWVNDVC